MAKRDRPVTLNDIARAAGVSPSAVSYALNDRGRVSAGTRERIAKIAQGMNYQPNAVARSLVGVKTGLAALAFSRASELPNPSLEVDYFSQTVHGAMAEAMEENYAIVLIPSTRRAEVWRQLPVDGVVILDPVPADPLLASLKDQRKPYVIVGKDPSDPDAAFVVDNDHVAGTRACLEHLREYGARRVALYAADLDDSFTSECIRGYDEWTGDHGAKNLMEMVPVPAGQLYERVVELLSRRDRPDGIYANTEPLGLGVVHACNALGLRVPEDVMVVACSDRNAVSADGTSLTALRIFPDLAGKEAIKLLLARIADRPIETTRIVIPTRLDVAGSTAGAVASCARR